MKIKVTQKGDKIITLIYDKGRVTRIVKKIK